MLSPERVLHFETFGFVVLRQAFTAQETAEISREFDEVLAADRPASLCSRRDWTRPVGSG